MAIDARLSVLAAAGRPVLRIELGDHRLAADLSDPAECRDVLVAIARRVAAQEQFSIEQFGKLLSS